MSQTAKPYELIAARIVELLQEGLVPWRRPWTDAGPPRSLATGKPYRGINTFMLACESQVAGYASPWWMTFKQARERGGSVRKGEKGAAVVFWKMWEVETPAEEEKRKIPMLRHFRVFNAEQCDGVDVPVAETKPLDFDPIIQCERIVGGMPSPPAIEHGGARAYYRPSSDTIRMPPAESFRSAEEYYATLFHEIAHSTGHESRLNRETLAEKPAFGSRTYGREELVAEMASSFLCGRAGIDHATLENSAAYIRGWLGRIREEPRIAVQAASAAQKAADHVLCEEREALNVEAVREAAGRQR